MEKTFVAANLQQLSPPTSTETPFPTVSFGKNMKPPHSWMSDRNRSLHYAFAQKIVMALYAVGFGIFWIPIFTVGYVLGLFREWPDIVVPTLALSIAPAWWFSRITAHHMAYDDQRFGIAAENTIYPMILKLAFVPVFGRFAERILRSQKAENPFVESTNKSSD